MTSPEKDYKAIITRIVKTYQDQLTDWEIEFIASVYDQHVLGERGLSEKQKDVIIKINAKMLGRER